jgi:hypothetical protein
MTHALKLKEVLTVSRRLRDNYSVVAFPANERLAVTDLHAFVTIRDGEEVVLKTSELKRNDKIWVDVSAFGADKSLFATSSPPKMKV